MAWSPADIGGSLYAWYDASDTATITSSSNLVTQWNDKSGNSRHLTASGSLRPTTGTRTMNGRNALDFGVGGTPNVLYRASFGLSQPLTVFAVVLADSFPGAVNRYFDGYDNVNAARAILYYDKNITNTWRLGATSNSGRTPSTATPMLHTMVFNDPTTKFYDLTTQYGGNLDTDPGGIYDLNIGAGGIWSPTTGDMWDGLVCEIVIMSGAATDTEIYKAQAYLHSKWMQAPAAQPTFIGAQGRAQYGGGPSLPVVKPPLAIQGDQLLVYVANSNGQAITPPAGFTQVFNQTVSTSTHGLWRRTIDETEPLTFDFSWTTSVVSVWAALVYRFAGYYTNTRVDNSTSSSSRVLPSITTVSANNLLVYGGSWKAVSTASATGPAGSTERIDDDSDGTGYGLIAVYDQLQAAAGATGTRTITGTDSAIGGGFMVALYPVVPPVELNHISIAPTLYQPTVTTGAVTVELLHLSMEMSFVEMSITDAATNTQFATTDANPMPVTLYQMTATPGAAFVEMNHLVATPTMHEPAGMYALGMQHFTMTIALYPFAPEVRYMTFGFIPI